MKIDVKVTLTIKGNEIDLTFDELKEIRDKINTIIGEVKEYVPVPYPNEPYVPDPMPPWRKPIITYTVSSWGSDNEME